MRFLFLIILLLTQLSLRAKEIPVYDVVIVGGGMAGTYSAWRLSQEKKRIALFEMSDRIGGRVFSVKLPQFPNLIAECGAMRFLPQQKTISGLIDHLRLEKVFFGYGENENLTFVRRVRVDNELKAPYNLRESEKGKTPAELVTDTLYHLIPEIKGMPFEKLREYLKTVTIRGTPLWQMGFWNLLMGEMSSEAFRYALDVGGYYTNYSNWNAYSGILGFFLYGTDDIFYRLEGGFDTLPKTLALQSEERGGEIYFNREVTKLSLVKEKEETLIQIDYRGKAKGSVLARNVILALPKRAITLLDCQSFIFSKPEFVTDLQRVTGIQASKTFLWYDQEWWTKEKIYQGYSSTDLPVRRCYYFGTKEGGAQGEKGLLMASYSDGEAVDFWEGYFPHSAFDAYMDPIRPREEFLKHHAIPSLMLKELNYQLSEIHGLSLPQSSATLFQNWADNPYGGGWHVWNPFNEPWKVAPRIRRPFAEYNLFICGEAYSEFQGWIEGALNTAEMMLEEYFGLSRPSWLDPAYNLGT